MKIIQERTFDEDKIKKPSFMNNKTRLGSIEFGKNCACPVYAYDGKYYIHHRDWKSPMITFSQYEAITGKKRPKRFIYNDSWGGVILRCEAIIEITPADWEQPIKPWCWNTRVDNLCVNLAKMDGETGGNLYRYIKYPWEYFFEQFIDFIYPKRRQNEVS